MFSKLYIEPPKSPVNDLLINQMIEESEQVEKSPLSKKLNVSRYPRTSLPTELKMKFEVDTAKNSVHPKPLRQSPRRGTAPHSPRRQSYANLYNDEFWRQS
jgi:hypothetical protein